ncbi:aminoglycoside phosphotransferase (APT) family kinase protein [Bacillus ectoiniformans]|uniref:phosphotransferase family protein n=1 Tax=Bacillus ectoiniformans TaxID=1494429 RepID=UPI001EF7BF5A|nr:phosphotransferase family protein [Bacillus ectoiniformans]MBM7648696.1 aminoglycoside phosphotransferase (APT) family kinase protein [Bacillus ectoiniformans]
MLKDETIHWDAVEQLVRSELGLASEVGEMKVRPFTSGYSNLTYIIQIGQWEGVLRRPPFGQLPKKAHDMEREYKILSSIHPVYPKAPEPLLYVDDAEVMDKHFYIMELKKGVVLDEDIPAKWQNDETKKLISETFIKELAALHSIDIYKHGLDQLGKTEGFLERQVHGWIKRYHQSKTEDWAFVSELEDWLIDHVLLSSEATIVHNDFKLNNLMFQEDNPNLITAVFDWEMSTVGDPLLDLGVSLAYWTEAGEAETGLTAVTNQSGFLTRKELAAIYAKETGRDLENIDYYISFAFYKIAVILQQIYARYKRGEVKDERFANLHIGIGNLMQQAWDTAGGK